MTPTRNDDTLLYDLWLTTIKGIGPTAQHTLLAAFDSPLNIYNATEADLEKAGISRSRRKLILEARDLDASKALLDKCRKLNIFLLTTRDEIYPAHLKQIPDLPILLYGKGRPDLFDPNVGLGIDLDEKWQPFGPDYVPTELDWWWVDEPLITHPHRKAGIVGARRCTQEDKQKCIALVEQYKDGNPSIIIVSGGAKGIDGYAHTAAVKNGLRTIAFIGTGPDICYPKEHNCLYEAICDHGMILSEYPPGTTGMPFNFPRRNRLIAAWSDEMYIIGAKRGSGTQTTRKYFDKYHGEREDFFY